MNHRRERSGLVGIVPLALSVGVIVAVWPAAAADKEAAVKPAWSAHARQSMQRMSVGMDGSVLYARDDERLIGFNTADGSQKYQVELDGVEEDGYWGQVDDTTYVYSTSKEIVGIDVDSGTERWRKSPGNGIKTGEWRKPRVGHPKAMLLSFGNGVSLWDIGPGTLLWSAKEPLSQDLIPNSWSDDDDPGTGVLMFLEKRTVLVGPSGQELWSVADKGNERRGGKEILMSAVYRYGKLLLVYLSKQVVLVNNVTGEVLASQAFPSPEAGADVEALLLQEGGVESLNKGGNPPLALTLGGRLVIADPKEGKVLVRTPENSILGQAVGGFAGDGDILAMTAVRGGYGNDAGMHLYRINPTTGEVKWHTHNRQQLEMRSVMSYIVGDRINGPYYLEKAKGVLLATIGTGVRLYNWEDGKERWAVNEELPYSYRVMKSFGSDSFEALRDMEQNRMYVSTNPRPVEGDGVVYVAGSDNVFAIDSASGKVKWESKSSSLGLISGLEASAGMVVARQGLYADSNDYGAPTAVVTRLLGPAFEDDPEVYIDEDPYGFVGLDAATGKEAWKCVDFESHDTEMRGPMPRDKSICQAAKVSKEKSCKLSKLGIGGIAYSYSTPRGIVYVGKDGIASAAPGSCTAQWSVEGSIKKLASIFEISAGGEHKASGFVQHDDPSYLITHYDKDVSVIDVAAGKVVVTAGKAESVKVKWSNKMLFVAEGNDVAMYKLP